MYHESRMFPLFRRQFNLTQASVRPSDATDVPAVSRLLSYGWRRFIGLGTEQLAALLTAGNGMVLTIDDAMLGALIASWPSEQVCWLRVAAFTQGVGASEALDCLLPAFHQHLHSRGITTMYYAGDSSSDAWLVPALTHRGYALDTEVIVYENTQLQIPHVGNREVRIRQTLLTDLSAVLAVDRASFRPEWLKDDRILGPAIITGPLFMVAELNGLIVGYVYATSHMAGRLVHLVRIAVNPQYRGMQIGVRLLAQVVDFARNQGAVSLTLNTQANNLAAQTLYERFGFERTGERQPILCSKLVLP
jgi:ribosomal protein S18 acetylase RimI-like enzyme